MIRENRQLVIDELIEFEKKLVEVPNFKEFMESQTNIETPKDVNTQPRWTC